ncbi:MAG: glucoamylase [Gemmatimonadetes bacterium]|nr:glucoamylase [Gemmatimonadota bacterium]
MPRIEEYALIGDCETGALVSRDGSIDWLCWPRFDSGACFAALLGGPGHGRWRIGVAEGETVRRTSRRYRGDTMVLETEIETDGGTVALIDFMPVGGASDVVRIVEGRRGTVRLTTELVVRFDYGSVVPWVSRLADGRLRVVAGPDMITLASDVPTHGEHLTTVGEFTVRAGGSQRFVLTWSPSHLPPADTTDPAAALARTEAYWREWAARCSYSGRWREAVVRSLLTLKALTYGPTGGIVAAPTTSLPEEIGGTRNWDYRFCWLRDATLTLLALMDAGYVEEAGAWRDWLLRAAAGSPSQVQIMYGLAGERLLREWELPWLPGYEGSAPVRVGNAASAQTQLDVSGEVMDALFQARIAGLRESDEAWALQVALAGHVARVWALPDQGIWEVRGPAQHFTHSKVMAWVAIDRAVKSVEQFGLAGPVDDWRALRDEIHDDVCRRAWNATLGCFVQAYGSSLLDASVLQLPLVGFLPADDPRVRATILAIERHLAEDGFVLRYDSTATDDGLPPGEGAFLACSFWLADCLALIGRRADAEALFERLLALRTDLGLLSEGYDPGRRRLVGNFPQGFSHLALIGTAFNLARHGVAAPAEQRGAVVSGDGAGTEPGRTPPS